MAITSIWNMDPTRREHGTYSLTMGGLRTCGSNLGAIICLRTQIVCQTLKNWLDVNGSPWWLPVAENWCSRTIRWKRQCHPVFHRSVCRCNVAIAAFAFFVRTGQKPACKASSIQVKKEVHGRSDEFSHFLVAAAMQPQEPLVAPIAVDILTMSTP